MHRAFVQEEMRGTRLLRSRPHRSKRHVDRSLLNQDLSCRHTPTGRLTTPPIWHNLLLGGVIRSRSVGYIVCLRLPQECRKTTSKISSGKGWHHATPASLAGDRGRQDNASSRLSFYGERGTDPVILDNVCLARGVGENGVAAVNSGADVHKERNHPQVPRL